MSSLLNIVVDSIKKSVSFEHFNSLVELIDYNIVDKDYVFDEPFSLALENSLIKKEYIQISSIKDLFLFIQKYTKINNMKTEIYDIMTNKIKELYNVIDYNLFFKVKLDDARLFEKNSHSHEKLSELLCAIPKKELNTILENADPEDKQQKYIRNLLFYVLFSDSVSDIFFKYVERDIFFNALQKIKTIENDDLYHYIKENLYINNSEQQNKEIERLLHGLDKYPELHNHVVFGEKAILHHFLMKNDSFRLIMKNFEVFDSRKQNQIKDYVFEDFFNPNKRFNKPSVLHLYKVDNLFYHRSEFDENMFTNILKQDPSSFFVLLTDSEHFKSYIQNMNINFFSVLIDVHYMTKDNFQLYIKEFPELLSQSKNKENNLTNFLISEEGRFADWYKMRLYMFEKLNLETFAKKCDNIYLNLFNQNFYFSLFSDSNRISNKQLNERAKKIFVKKLIQYEKDHNIQNCLSTDYFDLINISYEYVKDQNHKNAEDVLHKLRQISPELAFNILSAKGYIDTICKNDKNKQFEQKLNILFEQLSLSQSISANTAIQPKNHRI